MKKLRREPRSGGEQSRGWSRVLYLRFVSVQSASLLLNGFSFHQIARLLDLKASFAETVPRRHATPCAVVTSEIIGRGPESGAGSGFAPSLPFARWLFEHGRLSED